MNLITSLKLYSNCYSTPVHRSSYQMSSKSTPIIISSSSTPIDVSKKISPVSTKTLFINPEFFKSYFRKGGVEQLYFQGEIPYFLKGYAKRIEKTLFKLKYGNLPVNTEDGNITSKRIGKEEVGKMFLDHVIPSLNYDTKEQEMWNRGLCINNLNFKSGPLSISKEYPLQSTNELILFWIATRVANGFQKSNICKVSGLVVINNQFFVGEGEEVINLICQALHHLHCQALHLQVYQVDLLLFQLLE